MDASSHVDSVFAGGGLLVTRKTMGEGCFWGEKICDRNVSCMVGFDIFQVSLLQFDSLTRWNHLFV